MSVTGRGAKRLDFVVQRLPVASEDVGARDDDVDLPGPGRHRRGNLREALFEGAQPRGKTRRHRRDRDPRPAQRFHCRGHERVIDADGRDLNVELPGAQSVEQVFAEGTSRLCAQPPDVPRRVVA